MTGEIIQECISIKGVCILKWPTIIGTIVSVFAIVVPFWILGKQRRNDIRREKIKKIEEILIDYNEIFNAISKFKEKRFGRKTLFINSYLNDDINLFIREFETLKDFFYHKEAILNVKFKIYVPNLFESYQKHIRNASEIVSSINNIIMFDINAYEKGKVNEYLEGVKSKKEGDTAYNKIDQNYSLYLDKNMDFDNLVKQEIDKLLK